MKPHHPTLTTPKGACDCHMHIVYPASEFPVAEGRSPYPEASIEAYQTTAKRLGIERCIMTQTPRYGFDGRWVLRAIEAFGEGALGTVAVNASIDQKELEHLTKKGIRGAALHMLAGRWVDWEDLPAIAKKVMGADWHLHIQLDGRELESQLGMLENLPNTIVIDHIGKFSEPTDVNHPGFKALQRLIDTGRCYVKLSAPYESSWCDHPYGDHAGGLASALIKQAPERMLWGSNWPHLGRPDPASKPDDALLLETLLHWTDKTSTRNQILSDNPARLYKFG